MGGAGDGVDCRGRGVRVDCRFSVLHGGVRPRRVQRIVAGGKLEVVLDIRDDIVWAIRGFVAAGQLAYPGAMIPLLAQH